MNRFFRAPLAAVLAFIEEWQPPIAPRRIMADAVDALNDYEELHETLPEPSSARFGSTWCATHHTTISTCYQEHTHTHTRPDETVELDYVEQAKERGWSQCLMHDHTQPVCAPCCYADNGYCDCECHTQSSPTTSAGECVWSFTSAECRRGGTCICDKRCDLHGRWCAGEKCWYQLRLAEFPDPADELTSLTEEMGLYDEPHPQSSPNPHGDLPSVPMPADGSAAEVSAAPPAPSAAPSTSQPHECGERDDYWQGAPGDKHTCRVCGDTWTAEEFGPLDIEWVRDEPAPSHPRTVVLPAEFDKPSGLAALVRHHGLTVEFDDEPEK